MLIRIIAVGSRLPAWADTATGDFLKRLPSELRIEIAAVRTEPRGQGRRGDAATAALMAREAERIRAQLPPRSRLVVLDERGEDTTTIALAARLAGWQRDGDPVAIVIGGPDGLDPALRRDAAETLRLSSLTLPHALVRVLLAEQLYRAWSVNAGHPYHRE